MASFPVPSSLHYPDGKKEYVWNLDPENPSKITHRAKYSAEEKVKWHSGKDWVKGDKYKAFILGEPTITFGPTPTKIVPPSWQEFFIELISEMSLKDKEIFQEWNKLITWKPDENKCSFVANPLVYCYYITGLIPTKYKGKCLKDKYTADPQAYWERVCKMDRRKGRAPSVRDAYELNKAITFFKPTTAKHLIWRLSEQTTRQTILDPCAGWGGRVLGALSMDHDYIGYDTNSNISVMCSAMIQSIKDAGGVIKSEADIRNRPMPTDADEFKAEIPVDNISLVLTSPPYANLEVYDGMKIFTDDDDYYKNFLIPMISVCRHNLYCPVAINVSPKIYEDLTKRYGFPECDEKVDFLQQMGQHSGKKQDYVYVWRSFKNR